MIGIARSVARLLPGTLAMAAVMAATLPGAATAGATPRGARQRACGWIVNYGPGNWSLLDRRGEWPLGVQGGRQVPGLDTVPDLSRRDWQAEGPSAGQGCACIDMTASARGRRVLAMRFVRQLPLRVCRADPALKTR